jgi:class 3 adenylate cyclase
MVSAVFQAMMCVAFVYGSQFAGTRAETATSIATHLFAATLSYPLIVRAVLLFPHGVPPTGRLARMAPWLFAAIGPFHAGVDVGFPLSPGVGTVVVSVGLLALLATILIATTRTYRRADPIGRRQIKWVLFGLYAAMFPQVVALTLMGFDPRFIPVFEGSQAMLGFFPVAILIAAARYNLFDIDRLISATASYSLLAVAVLALLLAALPTLTEAVSTFMGINPTGAQVFVGVALAAVTVPAHRALRPRLDALFFPERRSLDEGIHHLLESLSAQHDPRELTALAGEQLDAQFRPESCTVYALTGPGYEPVFARGRAVPPGIEAQSPLVTTLQARTAPLAADRFSRKDRIEQLSLFDRAALDTLGAAVVVPVRQRGQLAAFLCMGPKRSGDIYTSTDLALLMAVTDKVSTQLERMDQEEITREARAMQQELRRFVPGAVAQQVEAGGDLEPRERPVSVLFVDIRGYTAYTESRAAHEVFTTINRYTQTVSAIVEKFGGSVVEFNGDGMMAVFGAPTALPDKERAAVSAGREMVATVPTVGGPEPLAVGVGVATGSAFVGSIQAVDRMIWTALGNTTNLAARLQGLTRDLDAAMVIDLATWRAAGEPPAFERREQVVIRGRSQRENLYVLSLCGGGKA